MSFWNRHLTSHTHTQKYIFEAKNKHYSVLKQENKITNRNNKSDLITSVQTVGKYFLLFCSWMEQSATN